MSNISKIIKSFSVKDTLNPKVWTNSSNIDSAKMISKVRKALLRIANQFIDYLGDDVFVEDIVLTGSLANFNWSEFSDFDLHVYVNLSDFEDNAELYKELYDLKKQIFNETHNIRIFGYDVELYAQSTEEIHYSSGVYSVLNEEWINKPKKIEFDVDEKILKQKIKSWTNKIDTALKSESDKDNNNVLESLKKKLKEYRKSGLEKNGELSYENLVFKFLRRSGYIEKLFDSINKGIDKKLSLEQNIDL